MNKLFPIVLALLFFSCDESNSKINSQSEKLLEYSKKNQWKEGWSKGHIMDLIRDCNHDDCDNQFLTCDELILMCKCDAEAIAHSFSYSDWQKFLSYRGSLEEPILTKSDLEGFGNRVLYQQECYYDNNLISDFLLDVLGGHQALVEELKDYSK